MNERPLAGLLMIAAAAGLLWAWWSGKLSDLLTGATSRLAG